MSSSGTRKKVLWKSETPIDKAEEGGRFAVKLKGMKTLELWVMVKGPWEAVELSMRSLS